MDVGPASNMQQRMPAPPNSKERALQNVTQLECVSRLTARTFTWIHRGVLEDTVLAFHHACLLTGRISATWLGRKPSSAYTGSARGANPPRVRHSCDVMPVERSLQLLRCTATAVASYCSVSACGGWGCQEAACLDEIVIEFDEPIVEHGQYMFSVEDEASEDRAFCEIDFDGTDYLNCSGNRVFLLIGGMGKGIEQVRVQDVRWRTISVKVELNGVVVRRGSGEPSYTVTEYPDICQACAIGELSIP